MKSVFFTFSFIILARNVLPRKNSTRRMRKQWKRKATRHKFSDKCAQKTRECLMFCYPRHLCYLCCMKSHKNSRKKMRLKYQQQRGRLGGKLFCLLMKFVDEFFMKIFYDLPASGNSWMERNKFMSSVAATVCQWLLHLLVSHKYSFVSCRYTSGC